MTDWKERARFVAGAIFCLAAALVLAKTGRDALFVQERGLFDLPKAYIGIAVLSGPLAFTTLWLLRILGPRTVRVLLPLATVVLLLAFSAVVRPGGGLLMTSFFMFVSLIWGVVFSASWLLASDLLDGASRDQTAEGFSLVGGAAIVGGVAAGALAKLLAPHVEPRAFLWLAALGLAVASSVMWAAQRRYPPNMTPRDPGVDDEDRAPASSFLSDPFTRHLMVVGSAAAVVGLLVEFQFYLAASVAGGGGRDKAGFFASFYLVLNLAALAVQVWVLPRLLRRVGVGGALLVLPVALLGGSVGLALSASLLAAAAVRVAEGGLKSSIYRASWEQAYLSLGASVRARAKVFIEGTAAHLAEGVVAVALLLWLHFVVGETDVTRQHTVWVTSALVLGILGWLVSTRALTRELRAREACWDEPAALTAPLPGG